MKTKTTTTTEMRKAAHKLINLCNQFDKTGDELCKAQTAKDYDWNQECLYDKAREIEDLFRDMVTELNTILCAADAIDIHDYYKLHKEPLIEA